MSSVNNYLKVDIFDKSINWFSNKTLIYQMELQINLTQIFSFYDVRVVKSLFFIEFLTNARSFVQLEQIGSMRIFVILHKSSFINVYHLFNFFFKTFYVIYVSKRWRYINRDKNISLRLFHLNKIYINISCYKQKDYLQLNYRWFTKEICEASGFLLIH